MDTINASVERHHRSIILALASVVILLVASCALHDVIPICHYVFNCDHQMHAPV